MDNPSPIALGLVVIGAIMGFGRDWLTRFYVWCYRQLRKTDPPPRLAAITRLYLVFTSLIFTIMGMLGLLGIIKI